MRSLAPSAARGLLLAWCHPHRPGNKRWCFCVQPNSDPRRIVLARLFLAMLQRCCHSRLQCHSCATEPCASVSDVLDTVLPLSDATANEGVHYFHVVSSFIVALISALQLSGAAGFSTSNSTSLHPFEILSYSTFIFACSQCGTVFLVETCDKFEKQGSSMLRFGKVLVLAGMTIKLYYLIELKTERDPCPRHSFDRPRIL